ncbi:fish-egg lectin-like [Sphaeramia orbicularis]|uniref:Fish-egg lectin-like n=1 Tax=Sphaeramia orbicularis TaxID=375764 RepID=A0A673CRH0_9TELE|nr:fish-egg lectin-like [Sphaeramia orbicularis]
MKAVATFLLVICCIAISHAWSCKEAPRLYNVEQIDAGNGMVVGRDRYNRGYFLARNSWYSLGSTYFKHLTVGPAGLWGVSTTSKVYKYIAGNFVQANGITMHQVDAGGNGQLAAVSSSLSATYCLRSSYAQRFKATSTLSWSSLSIRMKYISCNQYGCWGIDSSSRLYFRQVSPTTCSGGSWRQISHVGTPKIIETGSDGTVFLLTTSGKVYQRNGVSSGCPYGTSWSTVSMCMPISHLSYDLGNLWVVTNAKFLLQCTH